MKQKKLELAAVLLFFLSINALQAQEAVTSAGGNGTGSGGSASYSVGQVAYLGICNSNGSVNQGVEQAYEVQIPVGENENKNIFLELSVYPNPTMIKVNLKIENRSLDNVSYQLFDPLGNLLLNQRIIGEVTSIPMESFPTSIYILKVSDNRNEVKTFKIIKNK